MAMTTSIGIYHTFFSSVVQEGGGRDGGNQAEMTALGCISSDFFAPL
jgi:hypothetical protein